MELVEVEAKVKLFDFYYEFSKLKYSYIELPNGETYCYKVIDLEKKQVVNIGNYPKEKELPKFKEVE